MTAMTVLAAIGMILLCLFGGVFLLVAFQIWFAVSALSGSAWKDPAWLPLGATGAFLIWLACYLSPFSVSVAVTP